MVMVSAYRESESFPRGRRVLLVPLALAFLIIPYGTMLEGGPSDPVRWVVAMIVIAVCTAVLALGLARPRRTVIVDADEAVVRISSTPPPPHFTQIHQERPLASVSQVAIDEVGTRGTADHGYRVEIHFAGAEYPPVVLRRVAREERARDIVDHLVLLGLPGTSRASEREAALNPPKPTTWL